MSSSSSSFFFVGTAFAALALSGCAGSSGTSTPGGTARPGTIRSTSAVGGARVAVTILGVDGPLGADPGPYAAAAVATLLASVRPAESGGHPSCPAAGCWRGTAVPAGALLLATAVGPTTCWRIDSASANVVQPDRLQVFVHGVQECTNGGGQAQQSGLTLMALTGAATTHRPLTIVVSASVEARAAQQVGSVTLTAR